MTFTSNPSFEKRSRSIVRSRQQIVRHGGKIEIGPDGLLTVRRKRGRTGLPLRGMLILAGLFIVAKALMMAQDGSQAYDARVAQLAEGGGVGQAGAFVMQADPLSKMLSETIKPLFR